MSEENTPSSESIRAAADDRAPEVEGHVFAAEELGDEAGRKIGRKANRMSLAPEDPGAVRRINL